MEQRKPLKRKIQSQLKDWKATRAHECLIVEGPRQVGKTEAVLEFGRQNYVVTIALDLIEQPELKELFDGSLTPDALYSRISLYVPGVRMIPGRTLLFVDELQECPQARTALGYLARDGRCDVVAAWRCVPQGASGDRPAAGSASPNESRIALSPLDFEEFLWARGYSPDAIEQLGGYFDRQQRVPEALNAAMMRVMREYLAVGGMPEAVATFVDTDDFVAVHDVQTRLLSLCLDDLSRFGTSIQRAKIRACFLSLPRQLAKENSRFSYATVERGGRARKFEGAVEHLAQAGLVRRCPAVSMPHYPLAAYEDADRFRLYAADTGLLMAMFDFGMKAAVVEGTLKGPLKGGLYENLVAGMLSANGYPLRYWTSVDVHYGIEFLAEAGGSVIPIEVKAKPRSSASLDHVLRFGAMAVGCRLVDDSVVRDANVVREGRKITLPLYMCMFL